MLYFLMIFAINEIKWLNYNKNIEGVVQCSAMHMHSLASLEWNSLTSGINYFPFFAGKLFETHKQPIFDIVYFVRVNDRFY